MASCTQKLVFTQRCAKTEISIRTQGCGLANRKKKLPAEPFQVKSRTRPTLGARNPPLRHTASPHMKFQFSPQKIKMKKKEAKY